ncbi:unnamed protein product [Amaranthus hypochondriacus]
MAGLKRKFEGEIEIRVAGGDVFHELVHEKPHEISNIHPELVQGCDLHDGDFGTPGSIICWNYSIDGKPQVGKEIIEMVDKENKTVRFKLIEGDLLEDYNSFVLTYQVIPEGEELSKVRWIFEYEKKNIGIPEPTKLMDSLLHLAKQIDDHHHTPKN